MLFVVVVVDEEAFKIPYLMSILLLERYERKQEREEEEEGWFVGRKHTVSICITT